MVDNSVPWSWSEYHAEALGVGEVLCRGRVVVRVNLPGIDPRKSLLKGDGCGPVPGLINSTSTGYAAEVAAGLERFFRDGSDPLASVAVEIPDDTPPALRQIQEACRKIERGRVWTYAHLAAKAGFPKAARVAGMAMARNRIPLLVPCHRIVRSDGTLGGFFGGQAMKHRILELEGAFPLRIN